MLLTRLDCDGCDGQALSLCFFLPSLSAFSLQQIGFHKSSLADHHWGICCFNRAVHPIRQMDISWLIFNSLDVRELYAFMAGRRANGPGLGIMGGYLGMAPWESCAGLSIEHH